MSKSMGALVALAISFMAVSCGVPRIDGSSAEKASASIRRVRQSVPAAARDRFDRDFAFLLSDGGRARPLLSDASVRSRIDGKTADDVFRSADHLRQEIAGAAHDQEIQRQLAEIRGSLGRMDAVDVKATFRPPPIADPEAGSLKRLTTDAEVISYCARVTHDAAGQRNCEASEMKAKTELESISLSAFPADMANRMQIACGDQSHGSFRGRLECMQGLVRAIPAVIKNPGLLDNYPEENKARMRWILGM